jgi:hypothetical protein
MPKAKTVGEKCGAQQDREMAKGQDGPEPGGSVKHQQDAVDTQHLAAGILRPIIKDRPERRQSVDLPLSNFYRHLSSDLLQ